MWKQNKQIKTKTVGHNHHPFVVFKGNFAIVLQAVASEFTSLSQTASAKLAECSYSRM